MESIEHLRQRIQKRLDDGGQVESEAPLGPGKKPYSLLIVEDEELSLEALTATFKRDYEVFPFTSALDALEYVRTHAPKIDLVLTDQRMPRMTGIQFLEEIKKLYPHVMKLVLTGYTETRDLIDAINKGEVHRYITKPADPNLLRSEVKQALEKYGLEREKSQLVLILMDKNNLLENHQIELKKANLEILQILGALADFKDPNKGKHALFVAQASEFMADRLNLPHEEILKIIQAAHLHDIGKMALPDWVLTGAGATTEAAEKYNKQHPLLSEAILLTSEQLRSLAPTVRHHHEWWNGEGFPDGLRGEAIPLSSRLMAVSDAYHEYLDEPSETAGPRKRGEALQYLTNHRGTRFEPRMVDLFLEFLEKEEVEHKERFVTLEDLQEGMVISRDVLTEKGFVLIPRGTKIKRDFLTKVKSFSAFIVVRQPIAVRDDKSS